MIHVFSTDHIDFTVPIGVQWLQQFKLSPLLRGKVIEIFSDYFQVGFGFLINDKAKIR